MNSISEFGIIDAAVTAKTYLLANCQDVIVNIHDMILQDITSYLAFSPFELNG